MFQTYIPSFIKHASMGAAKVDFKKFVISCLLVKIANQFLFIFASFKFGQNNSFGNKFTIDEIKNFILSVTSSSFIFLILIIYIRILPKSLREIKRRIF